MKKIIDLTGINNVNSSILATAQFNDSTCGVVTRSVGSLLHLEKTPLYWADAQDWADVRATALAALAAAARACPGIEFFIGGDSGTLRAHMPVDSVGVADLQAMVADPTGLARLAEENHCYPSGGSSWGTVPAKFILDNQVICETSAARGGCAGRWGV